MGSLVSLPFRYPGGKFYALKLLEPYWSTVKHDEYREPFVGGGAVFFAKPKVQFNWINDLDPNLITTYRVMADEISNEELIEMVKNEIASKERHSEIAKLQPKTDIEIAFKYFYLNRTSFSGKLKNPSWGYRPKRSLPPERWIERLKPALEMLKGVRITNLDFEEVIKAPQSGNRVLMYVDPPYYLAKQEHHYSKFFRNKDHERLCEVLRETEYKFFLTYNDNEHVREMYEWANIEPISFTYRLDNSQDRDGKRKSGEELVITNYKLQSVPQHSLENWFQLGVNQSNNYDVSVRTPLRYPGSKYQAIKFIKPIWIKTFHDEYREPFVGGGAVFFAKPKVQFNWINDLNPELIDFYQTIQNSDSRSEIINLLSKEVATKSRFEEVKHMKPSNLIEHVFKYYYINRTSYSGIMKNPNWGYDDSKSVPPERWGAKIESAAKKLIDVKITNLDFSKVLDYPKQGESVWIFVDPPYYAADQKRAYNFSFTEEDHIRLAECLKSTEHKFCLTYDDTPTVRSLYKWAKIKEVSWRYHTANSNLAQRKMGRELIITNY